LTNKTLQENKQTKPNKTQKANDTKYSKTKVPGSVAAYDTGPGNEIGLLYNAPETTRVRPTASCGLVT